MRQVGLQHIFPIVALGVLAGGSVWLERVTRAPQDADATAAAAGPDIVVEQMALTRFDTDGLPHYYLDARTLTHLPGEAHSRLEQPVVHLTRPDKRLQLSAEHGVAGDDGERVDLAGTVRGERALPGEPVVHFASEELTVWPRAESARSDAPVLITREDGARVRGSGMRADDAFGLITLTGRVFAHLPSTRQSP